MKITKRQLEYLQGLSSDYGDWARERDIKSIKVFLSRVRKNEIEELTKEEASDLIQILIKNGVEFQFKCGLKGWLTKFQFNGALVLSGDFHLCLSHCPKSVNMNDCSFWEDYIGVDSYPMGFEELHNKLEFYIKEE